MNPLSLLYYTRWANGLIGTQIETLPHEIFEKNFGGSFGSMRATLIHMLEAETLWLERFSGRPAEETPGRTAATAQLINQKWTRVQDELLEASKAMAAYPDKPFEFTTRKGQPLSIPFGEIIAHISHHDSYHRGQLANMIRIAGEKPVSTDYMIFSMIKP